MENVNIIEKAKKFAEEAHAGQIRKVSGKAFIVHPASVAEMLQKAGFSDEVVAAAWLHDAIEDTDTGYSDIEKKFGKRVADLVKGNSEDKELSWEARKQATINKLQDPTLDFELRALIIADKLDNLRSLVIDFEILGEDLWTRFKRGKKEQVWMFHELANNAKMGLNKGKAPEFFNEFVEETRKFFS